MLGECGTILALRDVGDLLAETREARVLHRLRELDRNRLVGSRLGRGLFGRDRPE